MSAMCTLATSVSRLATCASGGVGMHAEGRTSAVVHAPFLAGGTQPGAHAGPRTHLAQHASARGGHLVARVLHRQRRHLEPAAGARRARKGGVRAWLHTALATPPPHAAVASAARPRAPPPLLTAPPASAPRCPSSRAPPPPAHPPAPRQRPTAAARAHPRAASRPRSRRTCSARDVCVARGSRCMRVCVWMGGCSTHARTGVRHSLAAASRAGAGHGQLWQPAPDVVRHPGGGQRHHARQQRRAGGIRLRKGRELAREDADLQGQGRRLRKARWAWGSRA